MKFLKYITCWLFLLYGAIISNLAQQPNVLFIAVDDLNDWAGYRGDQQVLTPHMDRLASQGVWFSRAYCQYPLCGPSRASIMSGLYAHQINSPKLQPDDDFVAEKVQSMGSQLLHSYFKNNGYKTMAVGKLLHRHLPEENLDLSGGRGSWDLNRDEDGNVIETYWKSERTMTDWGYINKPEEEMSDSKAAVWAVSRLEENHQEPFILMVGFLRPHVPWYVPKKYFDMYDRENIILPPYKADDLEDVPEAGRSTINEGYPRTEWAIENNHWKHIVQSYLASITFVDSKIGMVLNALEESPYRDNTIVILWSDHGYHMGEKNTFQKHTLWDRSALVPMIIKLPNSMENEMTIGRCDRVVGLTDVYPTLVELCGLPVNDKVVGQSLKPLLKDPEMEWDYPALTFGKDDGKSLQFGDYRFIKYGDGSMELYDHASDPNEWTNLTTNPNYKQLLSKLKVMLNDLFEGKHIGDWTPIFNGTSLDGWHVACVDEDKEKEFFRVTDGTLSCNSMGHPDHDYFWLCTDREFTDFKLKLKFQVFRDNKGNSGVQIRSRYDRSPDAPGGGWLDGPQVDIHPKGPWRTGLIYDETRGARGWIFPQNPGSGIQEDLVNHDVVFKFADQGDGWNDMVITCAGTRIKTEVNGVVVCNEDFKGIIDGDAHKRRNVGLKGKIAIQVHRKAELNMRFKDLYIKELKGAREFDYDSWIAEEWAKTRELMQPLYDPPPEVREGDVVGWSADGGQADVDDWAAAPVALAIFDKMGWHDKLVHFDYNSRIDGDRDLVKEAEMHKSTEVMAGMFGFDTTVFFNDVTQLEASLENAKNIINSCHEGRRFFWCIAGPFEVAWRALNRADPEKRKYVVLISHAEINERSDKWKLEDGSPSHGMIECCNPILPPAGYREGLGARYYFTSKQGLDKFGSKGFLEGWGLVDWMKSSSCEAYSYMYTRLEKARDYHLSERQKRNPDMSYKEVKNRWGGVDASDGGMGFTIATRDWDGNLEKLADLLHQK